MGGLANSYVCFNSSMYVVLGFLHSVMFLFFFFFDSEMFFTVLVRIFLAGFSAFYNCCIACISETSLDSKSFDRKLLLSM